VSEYQRYEFMTVDRPLTKTELDAVNNLSSHIEATSTQAIIEYNWGDFKYDPIKVLRDYFDGFLYWANWGSPQLAFRFPHGILPTDLIDDYDFDDLVTFSRGKTYDILNIEFGEMEAPDEWTDYELASLIGIREELMAGDTRALYILWLACRCFEGDYDEDYEEGEEEDESEESEADAPPIPPGFSPLTTAQQSLAALFQVPGELLTAAARHSEKTIVKADDDIAAWIKLLSSERREEYLVRLAHNEPGLSRLLLKELRELGQGTTRTKQSEGERVSYTTLLAESYGVAEQLAAEKAEWEARWERERIEKERAARQQRLQDMHGHLDSYWRQVDKSFERKSASGYNDAVEVLVDLRDVAALFHESEVFQTRFQNWIHSTHRTAAFLRRLQEHNFTWE